MRYDFEWDATKARSTLVKHGVPFEIAQAAFEDPLHLNKPDPRYDDRWITTSEVQGTLLVVVHTDVENTNDEGQIRTRIRVISARVATEQRIVVVEFPMKHAHDWFVRAAYSDDIPWTAIVETHL